MEKSPTRSTDTFGKISIVNMGDFSTANSVNTPEKKKKNFFAKLFTCGCFSIPNTLDSLSTYSPCSSFCPSVENIIGSCDIEEVADNFYFFDMKSSKG
jgi:hypothetical protein